jgi:hypothetical protein
MHAAIRTFELDGPAAAEEIKRHVDERFVPMLRDVAGFVAYYWVDTKDGTVVAVAVFEDREGAEASTKRAMDYSVRLRAWHPCCRIRRKSWWGKWASTNTT